MKVIDILPEQAAQHINENQLISRMKSVDWNYEFDTSIFRQSKMAKEVDLIESLIYQLWKQKPERALQIWNTHCPLHDSPYGLNSPDNEIVTPSFLMRRQALEK